MVKDLDLLGHRVSIELDGIDVQILEMLQSEGRVMYKDIAAKTKISLPTVRARIERLREWGVIKKFTAIIDANKIAGLTRGFVLVETDPSLHDGVIAKLTSMKEVREVHQTAGSHPVVLKVEARNLQELGDLVSKKMSEVKGITRCSCLVVTNTPKEEYGARVEPNTTVQFKCDYCHAPILGKPYVTHFGGGRYYFNAQKCAEAFEHMKGHREAPRLITGTGESIELTRRGEDAGAK